MVRIAFDCALGDRDRLLEGVMVRQYHVIRRRFVAGYGETGWYGVPLWNDRSSGASETCISSVETWCNWTGLTMNRSSGYTCRATLCNSCVPTTIAVTKASGPLIDRSTCDSAATWKIALRV